MKKNLLVTNIQRFSLHDGPGIRTTIFMKGCSLSCPWCSNPENINPFCEEYTKNGETNIYGSYYTTNELYDEILKDVNYYGLDGGVTFSGGEALLQINELKPLLIKLKKHNITTALESSLFVPQQYLITAIPYIDYFYVDMKIMDKKICKKVIKGDLDLYRKNIEFLAKSKKIVLRIPVITNYTNDNKNLYLIIKEVKKIKNSIEKIELLKQHNLGNSKYESLGLPIPNYTNVDDNFLYKYKLMLENNTTAIVEIYSI